MNKDLLVKITKVVILLSFIIIGLIFFLFREYKPIVMGYIFGASMSILSFYLMNDSAKRLMKMDPQRAKRAAQKNYLLRTVIYAVVLIISALADYLNIFAALLGLTMVKNTIILLRFIDKDFY